LKRNAKVSVIIPNFNYAQYLHKSIESVLNQTHQNIELIVVNNGSTDNSLEVLSSYKNHIQIINQANLGQSGARNSGLMATNGELIAFLDADDFWESDKIENQLKRINPSTQLVYSGYREFYSIAGSHKNVVLPRHKGDCRQIYVDEVCASIVLGGESTALFTKELQQKVGKFDSNLNSAAGWDYFRRCATMTKFDFVDLPLSNYRIHENNMSKNVRSNVIDIRNAYQKFMNDPDWELTGSQRKKIVRALEWNLSKTCIKAKDFRGGLKSISALLHRSPSIADTLFK